MNNSEVNRILYIKMCKEQNEFVDWLKTLEVEDVLNYAYEYAIRQDILISMEKPVLSGEQAKILLNTENPLAELFKKFTNKDLHIMDIMDVTEQYADELMGK